MHREQIVKALECCSVYASCDGCPYFNGIPEDDCHYQAMANALALIRYYKMENQRLTESLDRVQKQCGEIIVECDERDAERLKQVAELTIELDAMRSAANSYKMDNQRLTEENERLTSEISVKKKLLVKCSDLVEHIQADTVRKMQERLKAKAVEDESLDGRNTIQIINAIWVDKIAKELLEEEGNER